MFKLNKFKAFTLAEALIALTIVAIIAALSVPVLKRDNFRAQMEVGAKKGYYALNAALDRAIAKDFKFEDWAAGNTFSQKMLPELNIMKSCSGGDECFKSTDITVNSSYILADGVSIGSNGAIMYVDANGPDEPNLEGVDIYKFQLKRIVDAETNNVTLKIEPDDTSLGEGRESAADLVQNGWKITAW